MTNLSQYSGFLESHYYGINGPAIKYTTRNICSDATAKILEEIAKTLFPSEEIEIYVIPAKDGCHQDSFWIKASKNPTAVAIITIFLTFTLGYSLYSKQLELTNLQIQELQEKLNKNTEISVSEEKWRELSKSQELEKKRTQHFEQLQTDGEIRKERFVAVGADKKIIDEKTIESIDFPKYIQHIPETKTFKIIEKIHELTVIQPVNEEEHKDLSWYVEDPKKKIKFGVYMSDENFYKLHFENVFGLKNLIARVRYTIEENEDGGEKITKKEILIVYKYNDKERIKIPSNEPIETAPFVLENSQNENFIVLEKGEKNRKEISIDLDQMNMF